MDRRDFIYGSLVISGAALYAFGIENLPRFPLVFEGRDLNQLKKDFLAAAGRPPDIEGFKQYLNANDIVAQKKRPLLQESIQKDFTSGKTVEFCGWVISLTEAELILTYAQSAHLA